MQSLLFVTSNPHKVEEYQRIIGTDVVHLTYAKHEIDEIQSIHPEVVAKVKAQQMYTQFHTPLIVEDVGLSIDAWNGFPGALIKHIHASGGPHLLLRMLDGETNRKATFTAAIGYCTGCNVHVFTESVTGTISSEVSSGGWGLDPVFIPKGYKHTYGQLSDEIKHTISHRYKAIQALRTYLMQNR